MSNNPYLDEIDQSYVPEDFDARALATLAVVHELREANRLTELINTPPRFVLGNQDPISPEDMKAAMDRTRLMSVPDDSGDARIAAAARRWVRAWSEAMDTPTSGPKASARLRLAAAELRETIRQEDER